MWRFVAGLGVGVYIGTYYECKPTITRVKRFVMDNFPRPRVSGNSESSDNNEN